MKKKQLAFTLVEMLVAITVLTLLVVLLSTMFGNIATAWRRSSQRMDNIASARSLLNILHRDLKNVVFRPDLAVFPSDGSVDTLAFYIPNFGQETANDSMRPLSYVSYSTVLPSTLLRIDYPYDYGDAPPWSSAAIFSAPSTKVTRTLGQGIYAFDYRFAHADGTEDRISKGARAVRTSILVLSDDAQKLLIATKQESDFQDQFKNPEPLNTGESAKTRWDALIASGTLNFPSHILEGIHTYERFTLLSN